MTTSPLSSNKAKGQAKAAPPRTDKTPQPSAHLITAINLSHAWLQAMELIVAMGGKTTNLMVVMPGHGGEEEGIRRPLEQVMQERGEQVGAIETVANTIFPIDLYIPKLGKEAAQHLYNVYSDAYPLIRNYRRNQHGTYFGRLTAWEYAGDPPVNQLERVITRLKKEIATPGPKSSAYELAVADAGEISADLRIQQPGDTRTMGFPCLSHISLTLVDHQLHMSALYRNQHFIRKAYGNYLGLSRLLNFICEQVGCEPGDIACWATHADAELSAGQARNLIAACKKELSGQQ